MQRQKQAHLVRECLKIANFYVRDQNMAQVLRTNILTQAASTNHAGAPGQVRWANML